MGAWQRQLRLARDSVDSVCLRARRYLHHALLWPHTQPHIHATPLHDTTPHSHILPTHTASPHSHLYFGYKLPVWNVPLGLTSVAAKYRSTLHIHSNHFINTRRHSTSTPLGKVYKRTLVIPPCSTTILSLVPRWKWYLSNPPKNGAIALQTPRTEFLRFSWYSYSANRAVKLKLLTLLVEFFWSNVLVQLNLYIKITKI